jgi:imidazolonepropionase-like amidohydrolase
VLLSAKYPQRERDVDPDAVEDLRVLRRRVEAPLTAVALARAGVQFAFSSGDMTNPHDLVANVARSVEAGLDRQVALRALTVTPAEIFGVADRLGTIEKGKTANLVVATGDLFDPRTRIREVFVDGIRFEVPESELGRPGPPTAGRSTGEDEDVRR